MHLVTNPTTDVLGDGQDAGSARRADEEDGNHEHPCADKQDAEGGEG